MKNLNRFPFSFNNIFNILILIILVSFLLPTLIVTPITIGLLFLVLLYKYGFEGIRFQKPYYLHKLFFALYFLLIFISLSYTTNLIRGSKEFLDYGFFLLIPIMFSSAEHEKINFKLLVKGYVCALLLIFIYLSVIAVKRNLEEGYDLTYLVQIFSSSIPPKEYRYFNYWYFVYDIFCEPLKIQPIYLGLFTNIGIVFLYERLRNSFSKTVLFQLFILFIFLALIGSRWQLGIGIFNLMLFFLFWVKGINNNIKALFGLSVIGIILLIVSFNPVMKTRFTESFNYKQSFYQDDFGGTSIRIRKWQSALNAINKRPILGYGIGDYKEELLNQYKEDRFYRGYYERFNAHNQYLETALALGAIGLFLLLAILFLGFYYSKGKVLLFFITNIYFIGFFTESMFSRQWGVISFPFFFGFAFLYHSRKTLST